MPSFARGIRLLLVLAALPAAAETMASISGRWYTEGIEHGIYYQGIVERHDDGTFTIESRAVQSCKPLPPSIEAGTWSYSDGVLLNWTKIVAGLPVPDATNYRDKFLVTAGDDDHHQEFDTKTRVSWAMTRVPPEFRFPTPAPCATS